VAKTNKRKTKLKIQVEAKRKEREKIYAEELKIMMANQDE
jgi:hypothetical protein